MDIVITVLVLAVALAALAYPLYRARNEAVLVSGTTLDDLLAQRDGVYATLRDLEMDQQTGKLDTSDYNALREKYMLRATEILQQLDALRGQGEGAAASAEIEQEVAALRHKPAKTQRAATVAKSPAAIVKPSAAKKEQQTADDKMFCTNCGRPYSKGDKFCAKCGKALN